MSRHIVKRHEWPEATDEASRTLNFLQQGSRSMADPFAKVKKMMEDMIKKLLDEAAAEAQHKEWGDAEIAKTTKQQKLHERNQAKFKSRLDGYVAEKDTIAKKISEVSQNLADMTASAEEMTKQRTKESEEAMAAIKEYSEAQAAVQKATQVISDFYEKQ